MLSGNIFKKSSKTQHSPVKNSSNSPDTRETNKGSEKGTPTSTSRDKRGRAESESPKESQNQFRKRNKSERDVLNKLDMGITLAQLQEELGKMKTDIETSFQTMMNEELGRQTKIQDAKIESAVSRFEDERRARNIIISGLPETAKEDPSARMKVLHDLFTKMGLSNIDVDDAMRLGEPSGGKPRPILVKLCRTHQKRLIMQAKKALRGQNVYVNNDLTKKQREQEKVLRAKFKELRGADNAITCNIRGSVMTIWKQNKIQEKYEVSEAGVVEARAISPRST